MANESKMSLLDQLKQFTTVVADTGDFNLIQEYRPVDATTNPSLLLLASQIPQYSHLIEDAISYGLSNGNDPQRALEKLLVNFGIEILKLIPGRVSTEVDARFSYNVEATIDMAKRLINMYADEGISKDRVLIKIASTWEGIQAARILEAEHGIHCNLTLMFSLVQAIACAEAGVTLISPFVGRILDWYRKNPSEAEALNLDDPSSDPGVKLVRQIYNYYKCHNYPTVIMGASFRNIGEIEQLAGIDYLTISPALLKELASTCRQVPRILSPQTINAAPPKQTFLDNKEKFQQMLEADRMANELLTQGIAKFDHDSAELKQLLARKMAIQSGHD